MSEYWSLWCETCDCLGPPPVSWNHGEYRLSTVLPNLPIYAIVDSSALWSRSGELGSFVEFAIEHKKHLIRIRSEYGYYFGEKPDWDKDRVIEKLECGIYRLEPVMWDYYIKKAFDKFKSD